MNHGHQGETPAGNSPPPKGPPLERREVFGKPGSIERYGHPSEHRVEGAAIAYYFHPTWRSQFFPLLGFLASCVLSVAASRYVPLSVIRGPLFTVGETTIFLYLPLFSLVPGFLLAKVLVFVYNSRYIIDERGVEAQIGLVSLSLRQPRLRYEDIRGVEPKQTIMERIFGIGEVLIGSAMTDDIEIVMEGVANPRGIQLLINAERDVRLHNMQQNPVGRHLTATGD